MRKFAQFLSALSKQFDIADLFAFSGLSLACYGIWQIYPPACWLLAGAALFWLGVKN